MDDPFKDIARVLRLYRLIDRLPVPCDDFLEWAIWFGTADRTVAKTDIGLHRVSTVFLAQDHNWVEADKYTPMLFETMIFSEDKGIDGWCDRCMTWDEAEKKHEEAVKAVGVYLERGRDFVVQVLQPTDLENKEC